MAAYKQINYYIIELTQLYLEIIIHALLKMGSRSDDLCVNVATKYTSYICMHSAAVANLCC